MGVVAVGETPILTGESIGGTHGVLEGAQIHPPGYQHQKGPICLWVVVEEVTESRVRAKQAALFPFGPFFHVWHCNEAMWVALHWQIPKALPLTMERGHQDKEIWPI